MLRLFAYLLFGLGIATAVIGGAKLPEKQVATIQRQTQLNEQIAEIEYLLSDQQRHQLDADRVRTLELDQRALQRELQKDSGWPPEFVRERFSDAMPLFFVGVGVAIVGLVLWRADTRGRRLVAVGARSQMSGQQRIANTGAGLAKRARQDRAKRWTEDSISDAERRATDYVKSVQDAMELLAEQSRQATLGQLPAAIEVVLDEEVTPFVERQDQLIEELGLAQAAPIMLCMAQGERLLNRAWSAAADGYQLESIEAISEACGAYEAALREWEQGVLGTT